MSQKRIPAILPENMIDELNTLAKIQGKSRNELLVNACQMYLDFSAANAQGSYLPQWTVQQINGICGNLQTQLNARSNQLLSSLAIQLTVLQMILADSLEIEPAAVREYTVEAVNALKSNNRVFRMEEIMK